MADVSLYPVPMTCSFEMGPIRPPSEAWSLLVRVTRNCPHNRCSFCPVYNGAKFSIRSVEEVIADIDCMAETAEQVRRMANDGDVGARHARRAAHDPDFSPGAAQVATFLATGGKHVFLQDANSLVMRPEKLDLVLRHLTERFPTVDRITTYARAHTVTRRKPADLKMLRKAGLNRVHVGLESGSDEVLELVRKGVDAERQIEAGLRVKRAGMELSEYLMPGLGGRRLWRQHARDSARTLSAIDPHFIRLRATAVIPGTHLAELVEQGEMEPMTDEQVVAELRLFVENLTATSTLQSDHVLNLLPELEGKLPEDKPRLLAILDRFLALDSAEKSAFVLGRRAGVLSHLDHLDRPALRQRAFDLLDRVQQAYGGDIDAAVRDLMMQFV